MHVLRAASFPARAKAGATLESVGIVFSQTSVSSSIPMTTSSSGTSSPTRAAARRTCTAISSFAASTPHGLGNSATNASSRRPNAGPSSSGAPSQEQKTCARLPRRDISRRKMASRSCDQSRRVR